MCTLTSDIIFSFVTWTYRVFNKLKVTIMGNGYGIVGYTILDTFLLWPAESIQCEQSCFRWTNLHDIVQNPDKRVAILGPVHSPSTQIERLHTFGTPGTPVTCISSSLRSSRSSGRGSAAARAARLRLIRKRTRLALPSCFFLHQLTKESTYFQNTGNSGYLYLIVSPVVRVVRKGFCCSLALPGPEENALLLGIGSSFLSSIAHRGRPPTFKTPGARVRRRVACISSSLRLSGSSGRGSAAARIGLVQKRTRFARKPLIKTH